MPPSVYKPDPRTFGPPDQGRTAAAPELRVTFSENMANWLRRLERFPALLQLAPQQRQWRLVWAQSFLIYLAGHQISRPGPAHANAFLAALLRRKPVRFPEQVTEAVMLLLASLAGARNSFAEAIKREGR